MSTEKTSSSWTSLLEGILLPAKKEGVVVDEAVSSKIPKSVKDEIVRVQSNLIRNTGGRSNSAASLFGDDEGGPPLPDRWVDFFCIVGLDKLQRRQWESDNNSCTSENTDNTTQIQPQLLDSYPKSRSYMELPQHLPTFCFPQGYQVVQVQKRKKNSALQPKLPEPAISTIVLTLASGHRLYATILTLYERIEPTPENDSSGGEQGSVHSKTSIRVRVMEPSPKRARTDEIECSLNDDEGPDYMAPKCWILLSHYPFFHAQSTMLTELFHTINSGTSPIPWERYVAHIVEDIPLPMPGRTCIEWNSWTGGSSVYLERPAPNQLSLLNVSFEPLFRTLSLSNILVVWATLLQEGKVVLCCKPETVALLTPIAEALVALLFPLEWQGIYIPVLPNQKHTMDILEAPIPYIVGVAVAPEKNNYRQPIGVLWCDLDNDIVHLGWRDDGTVILTLPALPEAASMRLKDDLEKVADPLFLPPPLGIKGRMTSGHRHGGYLENIARHPYAQMTRLHNPLARPTPRSYILSQAAKIASRGTPLTCKDYRLSVENDTTEKTPCCRVDEETVENQEPPDAANHNIAADSYDSSLYGSLLRQHRAMQAHADRLMSVFGQDFATPSPYANQVDYLEDILEQQDEITKRFYGPDAYTLADKVRKSFLRFFLSVLSDYSAFVNKETQRLDADRFVTSLKMSYRNQEYVRSIVESQMFELFLQHNAYRRQYFDEMVIRFKNTQNKKDHPPTTPFLDSSRWKVQTVLISPPPCGYGIPVGRVFCGDRRFPDRLDPTECVTTATYRSRTSSSWQGAFCSVFMPCTG